MDAWEYCKTKEEELKQRGLEGWEVYAIYHYGTTTYYMKRKKISSAISMKRRKTKLVFMFGSDM